MAMPRRSLPTIGALSRQFRREFAHAEVLRFVDRYGFRKVMIQRKSKTGRRGAVTDRDTTELRNLGEAPGVLPTFVLRHLLPTAVTVHKDDLDDALPPLEEEPVPVPTPEGDAMAEELIAEYRRLGDKPSGTGARGHGRARASRPALRLGR